MQLSLPAAPLPTPAATPGCGGKKSPQQSDSSDTPTDSFDSLLTKDSPGDDSKSNDGKTNAEAEQAAGILAAMLWMQNPAAANNVPVLPAVLSEGTTPETATDVTGSTDNTAVTGDSQAGTPFFGATNSRAFGKLLTTSSPVLTNSFAGVIGSQVSGQTQVPDQTNQTQDNVTGSTPTPAIPQGKCSVETTNDLSTDGNATMPAMENPLTASVAVAQIAAAVPAVIKSPQPIVGKREAATASTEKSPLTEGKGDESAASNILPADAATMGTKVDAAAPQADDQKSQSDTQEKIAPLPAVLKDLEKNATKAVEKYFLDPVQKVVTSVNTSVGIAVAKVNAVMSSAPSARTKSASLVEPSAAFVFSGEAAPTATLTVDAPAPVATVRETLAAVISAVDAIERRADVQQKSVDLNFNVGNEKLGLRVELKDGAVHTTFRTESPEMSSALSREWHAVVPTAFARDVKLAEPVFHTVATQGSNSSFTSLGQGAPQQQREQPKPTPAFASAFRREFDDTPVQETAAPAASSTTNSSQLLNALA